MFQNYVSLGRNCEVAFQIRRVLGRDSSSFFSWNVTEFQSLISLLENDFSNILIPHNISMHADGFMTLDSSHGFLFHSPFATPNPKNDPHFEVNLDNYRDKVSYLIRKLKDGFASEQRTAYFYLTSEDHARQRASRVRDILMQRHALNNFVLVLIQDESRLETSWGDQCLENVYVKRLAPWHDATDGHVQSYDRIFKQFPHDGKLHFAGF